MDSDITFQKLDHQSADLVLAVHHNLYGNRMVTASSDQHLRVWDKKGTEWVLTDKWRAHDGEITGVCSRLRFHFSYWWQRSLQIPSNIDILLTSLH